MVVWVARDELVPLVEQNCMSAVSVLDIGCGIRPQTLLKDPPIHICCEPCLEYVTYLQKNVIPGRKNLVVLKLDWDAVVKTFPERSVDTVVITDVIEHLTKEDGKRLLALTETIARNQVVVFTPLGLLPQDHDSDLDARGLHGGAWQAHKSGWSPDDFDETWIIYASDDFHRYDVYGNAFEEPFGAFYAVKTWRDTKPSITTLAKKHLLRHHCHRLIDRVFDIVCSN